MRRRYFMAASVIGTLRVLRTWSIMRLRPHHTSTRSLVVWVFALVLLSASVPVCIQILGGCSRLLSSLARPDELTHCGTAGLTKFNLMKRLVPLLAPARQHGVH